MVRNEQSSTARPEIKDPLKDISNFDIILLWYPIWHGHIPNIIITQLELLDLKGKKFFPFNTHGDSGKGSSIMILNNMPKKRTSKKDFLWQELMSEIIKKMQWVK